MKTLCSLPGVERGYGLSISYHTKKQPAEYAYACGKGAFMRSFEDPSTARAYCHKTNVAAAAIGTKGNYIASVDQHGHVKVMARPQADNPKLLLKCEHDSLSCGTDITWDADDKRLLLVGKAQAGGTYAKVIDAFSGNALGKVDGIQDNCTSGDYRKHRPYRIAIANEKNHVRSYAGPPFKFLAGANIEKHTRYPNKVKYSRDGATFISVGSDSKIFLHDAKEGTLIREVGAECKEAHTGAIYCFDWSPDGTEILTCSADKTCKIWNVESGEVVTTFTIAETPTLDDMQMGCLWCDDNIMSVSLSGAINCLDRENPKAPKSVIHGHKARITSIASSGNGKFYTSCTDGRVSQWTDFIAAWFKNKGQKKSVNHVACDGAGNIITTGTDKVVRITNVESGEVGADGLKLEREASRLAAGNASGVIAVAYSNKFFIIKDGAVAHEVAGNKDVKCLKFNPDDSLLAVGFADKNTIVYNVADATESHKFDGSEFTKQPSCFEWSPDGKYLVIGQGSAAFVLDTTAGYKQMNNSDWEFQKGNMVSICWSKSNDKVITVNDDLSIIKWTDLEKFSTKRATLKMAHFHGITGATLIDDERLVTIGGDGVMRTWAV